MPAKAIGWQFLIGDPWWKTSILLPGARWQVTWPTWPRTWAQVPPCRPCCTSFFSSHPYFLCASADPALGKGIAESCTRFACLEEVTAFWPQSFRLVTFWRLGRILAMNNQSETVDLADHFPDNLLTVRPPTLHKMQITPPREIEIKYQSMRSLHQNPLVGSVITWFSRHTIKQRWNILNL